MQDLKKDGLLFTTHFFTNSNIKEHADKENLKPYQCLNCEESFNFYEEILKHEKDIHKIAHVEAKCESCPQTFLSEQFHVIHKYSHDQAGEPPPIWCNFCEFTCTDQTGTVIQNLENSVQKLLGKTKTFFAVYMVCTLVSNIYDSLLKD